MPLLKFQPSYIQKASLFYPSDIFKPIAFPVICCITDVVCVYSYSHVITVFIIDEYVASKTFQNFLVCCCLCRQSGLLTVESSQMCIQLRTVIVLHNFSYVGFISFDLIVNKTILQISCIILSSVLTWFYSSMSHCVLSN